MAHRTLARPLCLGLLPLLGASACATAPEPPPAPKEGRALLWTRNKLTQCQAGRDDVCLTLAQEWPYAQGEHRALMEQGLTIACERGHAQGCRSLGQLLARTSSVASAQALERSCQLGQIGECTQLVMSHGRPQRPETYDPERAMRAAEHGCGHGDPQLCGWVLELDRLGRVPHSDERLDRALAQLHCHGRPATLPECRRQVGLAYSGRFAGSDQIANPARARTFLAEACEGGDLQACQLSAKDQAPQRGGVGRPRSP